MKASEFKDRAGRMASEFAGNAGISAGYWRYMVHKGISIQPGSVEALRAAIDAYIAELEATKRDL